MSDDQHSISASGIVGCVKADGAELCRLQDGGGRDYLWSAEPVWPRHAPVLFPIVGRLRDDKLVHDGQRFPMTQHGFARDRRFEWVERGVDSCRLVLVDDHATRALYPFGFRFEIAYAVAGSTLTVRYVVTNTGDAVLPASMGAHPAFRWPLEPGRAKIDYTLTFEADEPAPLRGVVDGLLTPADRPSPRPCPTGRTRKTRWSRPVRRGCTSNRTSSGCWTTRCSTPMSTRPASSCSG